MTKETFTPDELVNDPATNLPKLPEGYWWKVSREFENIYADYLRVAIMHKKPKPHWFTGNPTKKIVDTVFAESSVYWEAFAESADPKKRVRSLAESALDKAIPQWRAERQADEILDLLGDYPPKSL